MTADLIITKDFLQSIHLYSYEDVQEFLEINRTLEQETQKPAEKRDMDLIEECLCYIEVVMDDEKPIDDAVLERKYQEALARGKARKAKVLTTAPKAKKHKVRKAFIIIAAAIAVLVTTLTIAARVHGYKNAWGFVYQKALELRWFERGEVFEEDGITLIGNGEVESFSNIEEFLDKKNLNILYPQSLPEGLKIKAIYEYCYENGRRDYVFQFNNQNISMRVSNAYSVDVGGLTAREDLELLSIHDNTFYVIFTEKIGCQAICHTDELEYIVVAPDYQTLLALLQSMK